MASLKRYALTVVRNPGERDGELFVVHEGSLRREEIVTRGQRTRHVFVLAVKTPP